MEEKPFWPKKTDEQQSVSRELENHLYNTDPYPTDRQPQNMNAYDPWADWFNAGIDPEPFADNFGTEPEQSNNPMFFVDNPPQSGPWMPDQPFVQQDQQGASGYLAYPGYPGYEGNLGYQGYQGYQHYQEAQGIQGQQEQPEQQRQEEIRQVEDEQGSEPFGGATDVFSVTEPLDHADHSTEEIEEELPIIHDQQKIEAATIDTKISTPEEPEIREETGREQESGGNREMIIWKSFPEKSC